MSHQIIFGTSVIYNVPPIIDKPLVTFPGQAMNGDTIFQINEDCPVA